MKFCPQCGTAFIPGDRFCQECGYDTLLADDRPVQMHETPAEADTEPEEPVAENTAPTPAPSRFAEEEPVSSPRQPAIQAPPPVQKAPKEKRKKVWIWLLGAVIVIAVLGVAGWYAYKNFAGNKTAETLSADTAFVEKPVDTSQIAEEAAADTTAAEQEPAQTDKPQETKPSPVPPKKAEPVKEKPKQTDKQVSAKQPAVTKTTQSSNQPAQTTQTKNELGIVIKNSEPVAQAKESSVLMQVGESGKPKYKGPKNPVKFIVKKASFITRITTDHYNDGNGTANPGSIIIKNNAGTVIGSFPASGRPGSTGIPNMKWVASPNIRLEPGTYLITDSDTETWSKNFMGNAFILIEGYSL